MERVATTPRTSTAASTELTSTLIKCGIAVGPLFYGLVVLQMFIRPGFDIRRHAISLLSLGDLGWIQIGSFIVCGALAVLCAVGLRRFLSGTPAGTWGPILIGAYGLGMIIGGIFHPDPGLSFPPGAPAGMPASMSGHAMLHNAGFFLAFLSLIAACFVFMRRFILQKETGWAAYSGASGVLAPVFIVLGMMNPGLVGLLIAIAGAIGFGWFSVVAAHLAHQPNAARQ